MKFSWIANSLIFEGIEPQFWLLLTVRQVAEKKMTSAELKESQYLYLRDWGKD